MNFYNNKLYIKCQSLCSGYSLLARALLTRRNSGTF